MDELVIILPILLPIFGFVITLLLRKFYKIQAYLSLVVISASTIFSGVLLFNVYQNEIPITFEVGGWPAPFGIVIVADSLSAILVFMSQFVLLFGFLYSVGAKDSVIKYPTYYPLLLALTTGLTGALLTGDIFNLFVFIELLVISGTILTASSDNKFGTEAAYKYFYMSLFASALMLIAIGTLYISYGTLNLAQLSLEISANPDPVLMPISIAFLMATFMIKGAVFPFHFWLPDFHTTAPTPVSSVLSSVVVKLGIYGLIRMTSLLFTHQNDIIQIILILSGVIGVIYGGLGALGTYDAKRMLAYSTIGQLGFILVAIGWGSQLAVTAAIVFILNHSLIKSAMLMLAGAVGSRAPIKGTAFENIKGLGKSMPTIGILFFIGSLGLMGIPPTNGFISKLLVFQSGVDAQHFVILIMIGLGSAITMFYTMRAFTNIWMQTNPSELKPKTKGDHIIAPTILIGLVIVFGIFAEPIIQLATTASIQLANPQIYISAVLGV